MKIFLKIVFRIVLGLLLIGIGLLTYAFLIEPNRLVVKEAEIRLKDWDKGLDDFRIVMISDIHGGSNFIDEQKIRTVVQKANEQDADMIVLLGDYVAQSYQDKSKLKMPVDKIADSLKGLQAKYGVYAVLGNNDYWYNNDEIGRALEAAGYKILDDKVTLIKTDKGEFWLAGLKDLITFKSWKEYSDYAKDVLKQRDVIGPKVVALTHNPDAIVMITDKLMISDDFILMLAGHTHGGQVRFPYFGSPIVPSSFGQNYVQGELSEKGVKMFVTTGIGTSIIPVRFGVPPEIVVLTIRSE